MGNVIPQKPPTFEADKYYAFLHYLALGNTDCMNAFVDAHPCVLGENITFPIGICIDLGGNNSAFWQLWDGPFDNPWECWS